MQQDFAYGVSFVIGVNCNYHLCALMCPRLLYHIALITVSILFRVILAVLLRYIFSFVVRIEFKTSKEQLRRGIFSRFIISIGRGDSMLAESGQFSS